MDLIDWIPAILTTIATVVVAGATIYYAYTNHKLWLNAEKAAHRPRKEDEVNSIIKPIIHQCSSEIIILKNKQYWSFPRQELFMDDFQKNNFKKIIFNDFIRGETELEKTLKDHDKFVFELKEQYKDFEKALNTDDFRSRIGNLIKEYNKSVTTRIAGSDVSHYAKIIIMHIIMDTDVNENSLGDPFKSFWKKFGKEFLALRDKKVFKEYIKKMESLAIQIIEKNKFIVGHLEKILNEYTKEYGFSLGKELGPTW